MRRRAKILAVVVPALIAVAPAAAIAKPMKIKVDSTVQIIALSPAPIDGDFVAYGAADSPDPRCYDNRTVVIKLKRQAGGSLLFDVAHTGRHGGWLALHEGGEVAANAPFEAVSVRMAKRKVRISKNKQLICAADRVVTALP